MQWEFYNFYAWKLYSLFIFGIFSLCLWQLENLQSIRLHDHVGRSWLDLWLCAFTLRIWYSMQSHSDTIFIWWCIYLEMVWCTFHAIFICILNNFNKFTELLFLICICSISLSLHHRRLCIYALSTGLVGRGWSWWNHRLLEYLGESGLDWWSLRWRDLGVRRIAFWRKFYVFFY